MRNESCAPGPMAVGERDRSPGGGGDDTPTSRIGSIPYSALVEGMPIPGEDRPDTGLLRKLRAASTSFSKTTPPPPPSISSGPLGPRRGPPGPLGKGEPLIMVRTYRTSTNR